MSHNANRRLWRPAAVSFLLVLTTVNWMVPSVFAFRPPIHPASENLPPGNEEPPIYSVPPLAITATDEGSPKTGQPFKVATPNPVSLTPETHGTWQTLWNGTQIWLLRIVAPGATSVVVGFTRYSMPIGGAMYLYSYDRNYWLRPFTLDDNSPSGQLYMPLTPTNDLVIEVNLHNNLFAHELDLEIGWINSGFRDMSSEFPVDGRTRRLTINAGDCHNDVICPVGVPWDTQLRSVARYIYSNAGGSFFCSGALIHNLKEVCGTKAYFLTANHCVGNQAEATSMVLTWNFESTMCDADNNDGSTTDQQMGGATLRATNANTDVTLVELNSIPDPQYEVTYSGWDRQGNEASTSVCIHHPRGCEKMISFEINVTTTTNKNSDTVNATGDYIRVADWDSGTTEGGSSGSPLYNPNKRIIGQLYGGDADCGNNESDWFGKFSVSWDGGTTAATRLRDWLDPDNVGTMTLDACEASSSIGPSSIVPTVAPSATPSSIIPTIEPTISQVPSDRPSASPEPSFAPSTAPSTSFPSMAPSSPLPSMAPSLPPPSTAPSPDPSMAPSLPLPSTAPSPYPSVVPSDVPSASPFPSRTPSSAPSTSGKKGKKKGKKAKKSKAPKASKRNLANTRRRGRVVGRVKGL